MSTLFMGRLQNRMKSGKVLEAFRLLVFFPVSDTVNLK
jgi:hypothetical protein